MAWRGERGCRAQRKGDTLTRRSLRLTGLLALAFMTILAAQPAAVAAQSDPIGILKQLPGLKNAYARKYMSADMVAPPSAATPVAGQRQLVVTATVLEFTSPATLALAERFALNDTTIRQMLGEPTGTIAKSDADAAGPNAVIYLVRTDIGDGNAHALLIAHHDNLAFLIRADGPEAALKPALTRFGSYMMQAEPGTGRAVENPPIESTGGLWDVFPRAGDKDVLQGLIPMYDYDLLGPTGESPIGSATPVS